MPPFFEEPLSYVPEPTAEFEPPLEVVVVVPELDFFEPQPAANIPNAATATMSAV
jgi:hypothetical protein